VGHIYPPKPHKTKTCHGCNGKGWVYDKAGKPALCPVCNGSGKYRQREFTPIWTPRIRSAANPWSLEAIELMREERE